MKRIFVIKKGGSWINSDWIIICEDARTRSLSDEHIGFRIKYN